jgi:hypothetical protein
MVATCLHMCEKCHNGHDGQYGSGRFCSAKCARGYAGHYSAGSKKTFKYVHKHPVRLWNQTATGEVTRYLNKKDVRRLRKGKEIRIKVANLCVVLINQDAVSREELAIKNKIAKLEAQLRGIKK